MDVIVTVGSAVAINTRDLSVHLRRQVEREVKMIVDVNEKGVNAYLEKVINDCNCKFCTDKVINACGLSAHLRTQVEREVKDDCECK